MQTQNSPRWLELAKAEAWERAQEILKARSNDTYLDLTSFQDDPVRFCTDILHESYAPEIRDVMESVRDNPITIARSSTAFGKSHGAARIATWMYKCFPQSQVYLTAAPPLDNLRRILWGEVMSVANKHPDLFAGDKKRSLSISRNPLSFISCVAIPTTGPAQQRESKFSGKHAPQLLFIVDEGDAVPDEVYRGIEGCMSGGMARLLVMFNPRARSGVVYERERDNTANVIVLNALTHPNVVTGTNVIPGAVTRETTVRRINEWTRELAPDEPAGTDCFEVPEYLVNVATRAPNGSMFPKLKAGVRKVTEPSFWYMVMGEYPSQSESQLINKAWIDAAVKRWREYTAKHGEVPPNISPVLGVDVAEYGVDASTMAARYGNFVARLKQWHGIDVATLSSIVTDQAIILNADMVYVDGTGVGTSVAPAIMKMSNNAKFRAISVKTAGSPTPAIKTELGEFYMLKDQLWWAMREWFRTENAMIPPDPYLVEELSLPTYDFKNGKIRIMSKEVMRSSLKRSPDRADALCMTFNPQARAKILALSDH